jgi:zinc protease
MKLAPLSVAALAWAASTAGAAPGDPEIAFEKYVLANGLEVILAPDPAVPVVSVDVWYHVGSGHESPGKSGFAHLFEHMMFQGSKHVGEDAHFKILQDIGSTEQNGTTNSDRTHYFETVPSHQLEVVLWLESDRMGYLLDRDFAASFALQIDVVRNERRQRYDNVPYGKAGFALGAALYPEGHPYRDLTIGRHEDLVAASVDDVKAFFRTWYVPANATLAIVGDFDVAATKKSIEKWFGGFPVSSRPVRVTVPAPPVAATVVAMSDDFARQRRVQFAWHTPAFYAPGDAELDIIAAALTRDGVGRLYKALVYDRSIATAVDAVQASAEFSSRFIVTATLRDDAKLDEVKAIVAAEIAKVGTELLSPAEIELTTAANEATVIRQLQSTIGRASVLQAYNHYLGDPDKLTFDLDRYRTTTAEAIRATAAAHLVPDRMVTLVITPATATGGAK